MYRNVLLGMGLASFAIGCSSPRPVAGPDSGRVVALEDVWRDSTVRIDELERREAELTDRYLALRLRLEGLIDSHRELRGDLALLRESVETRTSEATLAADVELEGRLLEIEHRIEGLAAERDAMIEVLDHLRSSSAVPAVAERNP